MAASRLGILFPPSLAVALLSSASGCREERGRSQAFDEATTLFRKIYAEKLDSAYDDPRMGAEERLLSVVPPQRLDAPLAEDLKQRIASGRAKLRAEAAERTEEPEAAAPEDP